jgi:hypothetical protein
VCSTGIFRKLPTLARVPVRRQEKKLGPLLVNYLYLLLTVSEMLSHTILLKVDSEMQIFTTKRCRSSSSFLFISGDEM